MIVASVVVTALGGAASASTREAGSPAAALAEAQRARVAAEARLATLTAQLGRLDVELQQRFAGAADLAAELESARRQMRDSAIAAFVDGGSDDGSLEVLSGSDLGEISGRRTFTARRSLDWADAAASFEALQSDNDPELVDLAARREALASRVGDARDAVYQASAVEADAERASAEEAQRASAEAAERASAEEAQRASGEAAQRASAEEAQRAKAKAASSTIAPSSVGAPAGDAAPSGPPTTSPTMQIVLLTEPSAPLPEIGPGGPPPEAWAAVRRCESGDNYRALSRSGRYRGAYQFDQQTWEAMGGRGDPAGALPVEQDARAMRLFAERGARAWPQCGLALI